METKNLMAFAALLIMGTLLAGCLGGGSSSTTTTAYAQAAPTAPPTPQSHSTALTIEDVNTSAPIVGATLSYTDSFLGAQTSTTASDGVATVTFTDPQISVSVSAPGYTTQTVPVLPGTPQTVLLVSANSPANVSQSGPTTVTLLANQSLQPVDGASVTYNDSQLGFEQEYSLVDGTVSLPMDDPSVNISIAAAGYEPAWQVVVKGQPVTIYLIPMQVP